MWAHGARPGERVAEDLKLYIAGEWSEGTGDAVHELVSPVTGEHIANVPLPSAADIDRAVAAAQVPYLLDRDSICRAVADLSKVAKEFVLKVINTPSRKLTRLANKIN